MHLIVYWRIIKQETNLRLIVEVKLKSTVQKPESLKQLLEPSNNFIIIIKM